MAANLDFKQIINNINTKINEFFQKVQVYFKSLTQYEMYAWIAIGVGFIMVLIALITW